MTVKDIQPSGPIYGVVRPPGSKSITNRALLVAALASGSSAIEDPLEADDTEIMRAALAVLGVSIHESDGVWTVSGGVVDRRDAGRPTERTIDVGASGTTARFVTALSALIEGRTVIDGTARMRERPIRDLTDALTTMGARIEWLGTEGFPPLAVFGAPLTGGTVSVDARRSSQFASALMMIAPYTGAQVRLAFVDGAAISRPYLQTTAEVMRAFGGTVQVGDAGATVEPDRYRSSGFAVEPDASAAVYPWVAAAVTGGAVRVEGLNRSSTQADIAALSVLETMGCVVIDGPAGVTVRGPSRLRGVTADMNDCPDAVLAIAVAALFADGPTTLTNIGSLRVKETDRLEALATELSRLGATTSTTATSITIVPGALQGGTIETYDDHRMAMSFALAGLVIPGVAIADPDCVTKTWPGYFAAMEQLVSSSHLVVAIDGPGGSGKTTVSRAVADRLGIEHLDTGAFYRAATLVALEGGIDPAEDERVAAAVADHSYRYRDGAMFVDDRNVSSEIRSDEINRFVSAVSAIPAVRARMVRHQREWVRHVGQSGVVEGRDIGSVVFPEAAVKVYLTASEEVRAARRAGEEQSDVADVAAGLRRRDTLDSTRASSPLQTAADAVVIDTSSLSISEVVAAIVDRARPVFSGR